MSFGGPFVVVESRAAEGGGAERPNEEVDEDGKMV